MKKNLTELVFILDRSGSMSGLEADTIGGFNSMINKQKNEEGDALVTTVLFNQNDEIIHDRESLTKISPMTERDYFASGCTALIDAIGNTVEHISKIHKYSREEDVPVHTIFIITTDGCENASKRFTSAEVKKMIEKAKEEHGWEFIFLGANIDSVETAKTFGISEDRTANFVCDAEGISTNFEALNDAVVCARACGSVQRDWKEKINKNFKKKR